MIRAFALILALAIAQLGALADEICGIPQEVDADTLRVGPKKFRLDGIDAPELQQPCTDGTGQLWSCGSEAGRRLAAMIGGRRVCCQDLGRDWKYRDRQIGVCHVEVDSGTTDLSRWLVREGLAIDFMPYSCERFKVDEDNARREGRGIWKGCFVAPRDFRYSNVEAPLLGNKCPPGEKSTRARLLGLAETGPNGCTTKGKAHRYLSVVTRGIYHTPGCPNYRATKIDTKRGDQWFCSEAEAEAANFRKAKNCTSAKAPPKWAVRCR